MRIEQGMSVAITHLGGSARGVHDVGKQHRSQHPIVGHFCLMAGEELGDLLEGLPPRFNRVVDVPARELDVLGTGYVVGDVLANCRHDQRVVGVVQDEVGTRTVGSTARTSISCMSAKTKATAVGLAARRSIRAQLALISSFHGMSGFIRCCNSPVPHMAAVT
jgi:hypothetical protein